MRTKVVSFFIFSKSFQTKKKIKALRPKMTKIASRGSCLNTLFRKFNQPASFSVAASCSKNYLYKNILKQSLPTSTTYEEDVVYSGKTFETVPVARPGSGMIKLLYTCENGKWTGKCFSRSSILMENLIMKSENSKKIFITWS